MAIQRVMMTDSRKEDVFYEEAIKTLRTNMQFSGVGQRVLLSQAVIRMKEKVTWLSSLQ